MNALTLMQIRPDSPSSEKAAGGSSPDPGKPNTDSLDTPLPPPPGYSDSSPRKQF